MYWTTELRQGYWQAPHAGEIASLLNSPADPASLLVQFEGAAKVLDGLIARGLVEADSCTPALAQLCRESAIVPQEEECQRWREGVTISSLDAPAETDALAAAFQRLGARLGGGGLLVVAVTDYLDPRLEQVNQERLRRGLAWTPAKLAGEAVWIGPVFAPGRTACWRCLLPGLRESTWLRSQLAPDRERPFQLYVSEERLRAAAEFAAQTLGRWLLETPDAIENSLWSFNWATLESRWHEAARRTDCPACGAASRETGARKIGIESVPSAPGSGMRCASAESVIERLEPLTSPITGILRRFERRDLAPLPPVFTYGAVYNVALPPAELRIPGAVLQPGTCSGRGWTPSQAKAACLAEAVERYSTQFRGDEPRFSACYRDLGSAAIHPRDVLLFSERQYAGREPWNRAHGMEEAVPEPFDETEEVEWARGWSLTAGAARFLPMALCRQYYRPPGKRWIGDAESVGCAAGSRLEEAILHGLLEAIERDALGIWHLNQVTRSLLRPRTIPGGACHEVCARLASEGWEVRLGDITTDFAIPAFIAIGTKEGRWIRGSGCSLAREDAIAQALSELWQLSRAPSRPGRPPASADAGEIEADREQPSSRSIDLKRAIEEVCACLANAGHDVAVFDLTRPEIGFPVVRVTVPGLRSAKPRLAPGRLYGVPVRLGWLSHPKTEEELARQTE